MQNGHSLVVRKISLLPISSWHNVSFCTPASFSSLFFIQMSKTYHCGNSTWGIKEKTWDNRNIRQIDITQSILLDPPLVQPLSSCSYRMSLTSTVIWKNANWSNGEFKIVLDYIFQTKVSFTNVLDWVQ